MLIEELNNVRESAAFQKALNDKRLKELKSMCEVLIKEREQLDKKLKQAEVAMSNLAKRNGQLSEQVTRFNALAIYLGRKLDENNINVDLNDETILGKKEKK